MRKHHPSMLRLENLHTDTRTPMDAQRERWTSTWEPLAQPVKSFLPSLVTFEAQQGKRSFLPPHRDPSQPPLCPLQLVTPHGRSTEAFQRPPATHPRQGHAQWTPCLKLHPCIPSYSIQHDWAGASWVGLKG